MFNLKFREKFTQWEDKSNGINPFVTNKINKKVLPLRIVLYIINFPFFLLRLLISFFLLFLLIVLDASFSVLPRTFEYFLKKLFCVPLAIGLLINFGVMKFSQTSADTRKLGFGSIGSKKELYLQVKHNDLIISNNINIIKVLYLYSKYLPQFVGTDGNFLEKKSLFDTIKLSLKDYSTSRSHKRTKTKSKFNIKNIRAPIVCFPEVVRTNGQGILKFPDEMCDLLEDASNIHVLGSNTVQLNCLNLHLSSKFISICELCWSFGLKVEFKFVSDKTLKKYIFELDEKEKENHKKVEFLRETLAKVSGKRVKCVNIGISEYFSFLEYYFSH